MSRRITIKAAADACAVLQAEIDAMGVVGDAYADKDTYLADLRNVIRFVTREASRNAKLQRKYDRASKARRRAKRQQELPYEAEQHELPWRPLGEALRQAEANELPPEPCCGEYGTGSEQHSDECTGD